MQKGSRPGAAAGVAACTLPRRPRQGTWPAHLLTAYAQACIGAASGSTLQHAMQQHATQHNTTQHRTMQHHVPEPAAVAAPSPHRWCQGLCEPCCGDVLSSCSHGDASCRYVVTRAASRAPRSGVEGGSGLRLRMSTFCVNGSAAGAGRGAFVREWRGGGGREGKPEGRVGAAGVGCKGNAAAHVPWHRSVPQGGVISLCAAVPAAVPTACVQKQAQ